MSLPTPAQALWNQREVLAASSARLRALMDAVDRPTDLSAFQWAQLFTLALEFSPDLVIELGRGRGNSTCCFLEAASLLRRRQSCRLVSLCLSDDWFQLTRPRLGSLITPDWLAAGEVRQADILATDFAPIVAEARRCLVFWDAHGFAIAERVLGHLLPLLAGRSHLVAMHDMSDLRYCSPRPDYDESGLWQGVHGGEPTFWLGHICSRVGQAISIVDFTTRNQLPLHSADESLHTELGRDAAKAAELRQLLGNDLFALQAHWFWFSLNEATGPITFPRCAEPSRRQAEDEPEPLVAAEPFWQRAARRGRRQVRTLLQRALPAGNALGRILRG